MSTSLLCEKAYQFTHAKTYVFSDSVLCVGKMGDDLVATSKSKIKWYSQNNHFKDDRNRIDGMPTEFEWKIFTGITALGLLEKIQKLMTELQCEPEHWKERIIFMSMYNDIVWQAKGKTSIVNTIHRQLRIMLANSLAVIGLSWGLGQNFLGLGQNYSGTEPTLTNLMDHGVEWLKK